MQQGEKLTYFHLNFLLCGTWQLIIVSRDGTELLRGTKIRFWQCYHFSRCDTSPRKPRQPRYFCPSQGKSRNQGFFHCCSIGGPKTGTIAGQECSIGLWRQMQCKEEEHSLGEYLPGNSVAPVVSHTFSIATSKKKSRRNFLPFYSNFIQNGIHWFPLLILCFSCSFVSFFPHSSLLCQLLSLLLTFNTEESHIDCGQCYLSIFTSLEIWSYTPPWGLTGIQFSCCLWRCQLTPALTQSK